MAADPSGAETIATEGEGIALDFIWILLCAFLVFSMHAGFAMLESGFSRSKNVTNVLMKNIMAFSVGTISFFVVGYVFLMGTDFAGFFGTDGFMLLGDFYDVNTLLLWFFMLVFAATSATIVSGAIAERTKFSTFIIVTVAITAVIYPIYGHWIWGGGWLSSANFLVDLGGGYGALDFAGSGVVHAVGGFIALAGCLIIGPRIGKYSSDGKPNPIPGHSMTLAVLGAFILWFGWFGFNAGSTLSAYELRISVIAVNTNMAAAAGAITAMGITWQKFGKPDIAMTVNGAIGGLVGITAGCAWVAPWASLVIGVAAGAIVCYAYWYLESKGVDDVVGAISVHAFGGIWGLIALGLFADGTYGNYTTEGPLVTGLLYGNPGFFVVQLISVLVVILWAFGLGLALFYTLKKTTGVRVEPVEEIEGLDLAEHGSLAYPEFVSMDLVVKRRR
ncbi:MAG: ammonium transporter [Methanomassiliicoccales archaeon]|nr:ammonium transporter [Methanomassiliicoccales archaeon]NYT16013.1 ammonium transporter [Methanomassiliicoccales archaeon]